MKDSIDWYTIVRRLSLLAFILLTFWAVVQAMQYLQQPVVLDYFYNRVLKMWEPIEISRNLTGWSGTFLTASALVLWPITMAPIWFKVAYFTLGFWLILPYVMTIREAV